MKTRLLCVLALLIFAMGCKDDKKKDTDDDDKDNTEQSTDGDEASGESSGSSSDASCSDVYAIMVKIKGDEDAPPKEEFVAQCEKESTPEQRGCLASAKNEPDLEICFLLGKAPALDPAALPKIAPGAIGLDSDKLKRLDIELAKELLKAKEEFKVDMENSEKDFEAETKKIEAEIEGTR